GDFKAAFWVAVVPAFVSVTLLVLGVHEPDRRTIGDGSDTQKQLHLRDAKRLGRGFAVVVTIAAVLTLARFSEAFLVLRARDVGLAVSAAPWVMVVMSVVYAVVAYPAGAAADRGYGPRLLSAGLVVLVISDVILANAAGGVGVMLGAALWGLHMGLTQGLLAGLGAGGEARAPADLRGTAVGVFTLVCGVALLAASVLAGWLWDAFGAPFTFYAGAAFTVVAWIAFLAYGRGASHLRTSCGG